MSNADYIAICDALETHNPPFTDETFTGSAPKIVDAVLTYQGKNQLAVGMLAYFYSEQGLESFGLDSDFLNREKASLDSLVETPFLQEDEGTYRVTVCGGKVCDIYNQYLGNHGTGLDFKFFCEQSGQRDLTGAIIPCADSHP